MILFIIAAGIFLVGCGFAVIEGMLSSVLSDVNAVETGKAISISQMFFSIGAVVGPLAALLLINTSGSWKAVAYALSGYWASMIMGRYLSDRFHTKRNLFLKGGLLTSLLFIIIPLLLRNSMVSLVCFIGAGLGLSAVWPVIMSQTTEYYPKYIGTAMGIMMTAGAGGGIAIPFVIGFIANFTKIGIAFWVIPIFIALILISQIKVKDRRVLERSKNKLNRY